MRNRDLIDKKLSIVEGIMVTLSNIIKTNQPVEEYHKNIERAKTLLNEAREIVSLEPLTPGEYNNKG